MLWIFALGSGKRTFLAVGYKKPSVLFADNDHKIAFIPSRLTDCYASF